MYYLVIIMYYYCVIEIQKYMRIIYKYFDIDIIITNISCNIYRFYV